ncbi:adenosylmethionine--8-amino-7-oxononanoate transaminase [Nitratifractor sp.]
MPSNVELMETDLRYIWHPCTQMKDHETLPLVPIRSGKGVWLYDFDGNRYLDAISSWWVNLFGHANETIATAIEHQARTLEHVLLAGFTHEKAIELARRLVKISPEGLEKVFFADNGSSAIEVALKMSYHYHRNRGEERPLFLSLTNSYHGETLGALSVGDVELYKKTYEPLLIRNIQTPVPRDRSPEATREALEALEAILSTRGKEIAAMIVEPLVQGAGGMHMYAPEYLRQATAMLQRHGIHLIADEIMTGFGRTGTMFACEQAGISPDFMALSKGITGGFLPLAAVLCTDKIYGAFYCDYAEHKAFLHSHSYTGNPIACAAALATLEIFEQDDVIERNRQKARILGERIERFRDLPNVSDVRQQGMIAAVELTGYAPEERIGLEVYRYGLEHEVLLRPLGNVIYFLPPYVIEEEEIALMTDVAYEGIARLC